MLKSLSETQCESRGRRRKHQRKRQSEIQPAPRAKSRAVIGSDWKNEASGRIIARKGQRPPGWEPAAKPNPELIRWKKNHHRNSYSQESSELPYSNRQEGLEEMQLKQDCK